MIARRKTEHGSGLGRHRWVVERTFAWLHNRRRLLIRTDRRDDIHEGFLALACCLICWQPTGDLIELGPLRVETGAATDSPPPNLAPAIRMGSVE